MTTSNIDDVVDANFGGPIASLQYGNTNNYHTTLIAAGNALNVTGSNGLSVFMPAQDAAFYVSGRRPDATAKFLVGFHRARVFNK